MLKDQFMQGSYIGSVFKQYLRYHLDYSLNNFIVVPARDTDVIVLLLAHCHRFAPKSVFVTTKYTGTLGPWQHTLDLIFVIHYFYAMS